MPAEIYHPCLLGRERAIYSQWGEDGLIQAIFERIGIRHHWCFEVGAGDGLLYANTKVLRESGWAALLIEADALEFAKLQKQRRWNVHCVHARVNQRNLDTLLAEHGAPTDLDLGVIDVDGPDYWVWRGLCRHKPRVMIVEFADTNLNPADHVAKDDKATVNDQSGKDAIRKLGKQKGYRAVAATNYNMLFVRADQW